MTRVLVIGGTVFIGRAIVTELAEHGYEIALVHRGDHEPDDLPKAHHIHVDRAELGSVSDEIASFAPEVVVDNVALTRADAELTCEVIDGDVRFVVISSMDVYKAYGALHAEVATEPSPVDETSPVRENRYPYRDMGNPKLVDYDKLDVEETYAKRDATVLRLPMVYGPRDYQRREWHILRRVHAGRKKIPTGAGTWLGTRGYVEDVASGVRAAIESSDAVGQTFNLGERATYPAGQWAQMILNTAGSDAKLVRVPDHTLPQDLGILGSPAQHLCVSSEKARRVLGWEPTPHRDALTESVAWHMAHPPEQTDNDFAADDEALNAALG